MIAKRRILLLSYCLDIGGSERQLTEVARAMDPNIYEMHVGCMKLGGLREPELLAAGDTDCGVSDDFFLFDWRGIPIRATCVLYLSPSD